MNDLSFFRYIIAITTILIGIGIFLFRLLQRNLNRRFGQFTRSFEALHAAAEMERKRIDDQNRKIESELAHTRKMEALSRMAGTLAHDFNNFLTASGGYAALLKRRLSGDEKALAYVEHIIDAGKDASDMLGRISLFVKNDRMKTNPIDVNLLITETVANLHTNDGNAQVLPPKLTAAPSLTTGDPALLGTILYHLGRNAAEACRHTRGTFVFTTDNVDIDRSNTLTGSFSLVPGPFIRITVTDTGCGMDEKVQHSMFEPFFTTKPKGKGVGLSLAYVWWYLRMYHGAVEVESRPEQGTTFRVYLPLMETHHQPDRLPSEPSRESIPEQTGPDTILVVDDESSVRELYTEILEDNGYKVITCRDGREAYDFVNGRTRPVDLVLLDLMMPVMNGAQTFKAIRASFPDMKILLMSGYATLENINDLLAQPPVAFFEKSGDGEQLLGRIREIMNS